MGIKNSIKRILYKSDLIYSTRWQIRNIKSVFAYAKMIGRINQKQKKADKPRIVFFLQFPETWNSLKTVYNAAYADGAEVLVLCTPKPKINALGFQGGLQEENEAYEYAVSNGLIAVNGYDSKKGACFDLKGYRPDYIFYTRPYNGEMPPAYSGKEVSKYCKVCHIDYGADSGVDVFDGEASINSDFLTNTYFKFLSSPRYIKPYTKKFALQMFLRCAHYETLGHPRFDLLTPPKQDQAEQTRIKTIAWLPRWKVDNSSNNYTSHFLDYIEAFLQYMNDHQELLLIIRPHPLMFLDIVNKGVMSEEELNVLVSRITSQKNVRLDREKDYLLTLNRADVLVAGYTALIAEYFVSSKPIILCNDLLKDVHPAMKEMYESLYLATYWHEVESSLQNLLHGTDSKAEDRKKAIASILPHNLGEIGTSIYHRVVDDYNQYHK